jgi:hypothetical protein
MCLTGNMHNIFRLAHGTRPHARDTVAAAWFTPKQEGHMGYILAIMSVPVLSATGIYNPEVMKNGRCIAEPGSVHALFCAGQEETAPKYRTKKKYARR